MSIRKSKFNIGEKVKIRDDLQRGQSNFVNITRKMEDYAGLICTIEEIYYDEDEDYFSYLLEEDGENFYWEDSFFDDSYKDNSILISSLEK